MCCTLPGELKIESKLVDEIIPVKLFGVNGKNSRCK